MRVLLLLILLATSAPAYDYSATVRARSGVLAGALVRLEEEGRGPVTSVTDATGRVRFEGLAAETIRISFTLDGFFVRKKTVMNFTRKPVEDDVLLIQRIPWKIDGTVLRAGAAVAGVKVDLLSGADLPGEVVTGADGRFRFEPLFDTEFSLRIGGPGGRFLWQANRAQKDVTVRLDLARETPLTRR